MRLRRAIQMPRVSRNVVPNFLRDTQRDTQRDTFRGLCRANLCEPKEV
jgi:hypothetical protein